MEHNIAILILFVAITTAAPVESDAKSINSEPVGVSKSDEQIIYGNHQNNARQKEDDSAPADEPSTLVNSDTVPADSAKTNADSASTVIDSENVDKLADEPTSSAEAAGAAESAEENDISGKALDDGIDLEYYLYDYEPAILRDESKVHKKRRSLPLTAENMAGAPEKTAAERTSRVRRDLTADEIRALLTREDTSYLPADDSDASSDRDVSSLLQRLQESSDYFDADSAAAGRIAAANEAAEERLAILQYLYEHPEVEAPYESQALPPSDQLSLETPDAPTQIQPVEYTPVIYQGEMGLFVPLKRAYMSLVPGVRKRSSMYGQNYYGLDDESLRNLNEYKRLYTLAQELNGSKKK